MYDSTFAVIGMPLIGFLGLAGVLIPSILSICCPNYKLTKKLYFTFFNGLAAGVILGVGFIHSIHESGEAFSEVFSHEEEEEAHGHEYEYEEEGGHEHEGHGVTDYPWYLFIAMMAAIITFTIEEICGTLINLWGLGDFVLHSHGAHPQTMSKKQRKKKKKTDKEIELSNCAHNSECDEVHDIHDSDTSSEDSSGSDVEHGACQKHHEEEDDELAAVIGVVPLAKVLALFFGLLFHNIFVGIALGISDNDHALFIAIIFHQFFEGLGLGARIALTKIKNLLYIAIVDGAFALSCPVGIGIGMLMKSEASDDLDTYNIISGTFQAISGGVLIYLAIMHMLRAYLESGATGVAIEWHKLVSYLGMLFGVAVMSILGIWG